MTIEEVLGADAVYFSLTPRAWEPLHAAVQAGGAPRARRTTGETQDVRFPGCGTPPRSRVEHTGVCGAWGTTTRARHSSWSAATPATRPGSSRPPGP